MVLSLDGDFIAEDGQKSKKYDANDIKVLEGLQAVRKRPGMYIGSTGVRGLHHLVFEVVDNSIDEAMAGFCGIIDVIIHKDNSVTVIDNGRGIPVDIHPVYKKSALELVLTKLHAGGKFDSKIYQTSGGLHGVGVSVVNALSKKLQVEVKRDGNVYFQEYERGEPVTAMVTKSTGASPYETGTKVTFWPDPEIFAELEFHYDILAKRLREMAFLNKCIKIKVVDERTGKGDDFEFHGGIMSFLDFLNENKDMVNSKPVYIETSVEDVQIEMAMGYNTGYMEQILTFVNNINTEEGGTHLIGFKNALTRIINKYGKDNKIFKGEISLSGTDVREGLSAIISLRMRDPQFEGQTKTKLGNENVRGIVESALSEGFGTYLEENPPEARKIIEKASSAAVAREAARKARELVRRKTVFESGSLPGKLADCSTKEPEKCEIYLVEGDSAGGSAKQGRDRSFQAILPLRGKILNVEKARMDKILGNNEIQTMISAFGVGVDENFDLSKIRYHKIIIMTDADVDGAHIRTLLLTFLYRYMKPVIDAGYIYIAQPPLYKLKKGKTEIYAYSDEEKDKKIAELGGEGVGIQRYKGLGEMNPDQLWNTTMNPENRVLLKVDIEDAIEADRIFTMLMGDKVEPRRKFIEDNAKFVKNLDV